MIKVTRRALRGNTRFGADDGAALRKALSGNGPPLISVVAVQVGPIGPSHQPVKSVRPINGSHGAQVVHHWLHQ
jgi:hypothetical protein